MLHFFSADVLLFKCFSLVFKANEWNYIRYLIDMTVITVNWLMRQSNLCNNFWRSTYFCRIFIESICAGYEYKYRFQHQSTLAFLYQKKNKLKKTTKTLSYKVITFIIGVQNLSLNRFQNNVIKCMWPRFSANPPKSIRTRKNAIQILFIGFYLLKCFEWTISKLFYEYFFH